MPTTPHAQKCWPQQGKHAWSSVLPGSSSYPGARDAQGSNTDLTAGCGMANFLFALAVALLALPVHWLNRLLEDYWSMWWNMVFHQMWICGKSKSGRGTEQTSGAETERRRCRIVFEDLACQPNVTTVRFLFCSGFAKHLCQTSCFMTRSE